MSTKYAPSNKVFDWICAALAGWATVGIYIDGWAHLHLDHTLETFFTPWHGVFYSAALAAAIALFIFAYRSHSKGYAWRYSLPKEYAYALIGLIILFCAGVGDLLWHELLGIEKGIETLFSPTHILLAIGGAIAVSGPLHAVWYRSRTEPIHDGVTILSTAFFLSVITFMLQYVHPFSFPWTAASFNLLHSIEFDAAATLGIAGILVFTVILVGLILSTIRHWHYPPGSFTIILTLNAAAMTFLSGGYYQFILTAFVSGFIIDLLYAWLIKKNHHKMSHVHIFAFATPVVATSMYMLTIYATDALMWTTHMWSGAIFVSGIVGYLMSYLVIPERNS
jgi:hypothetical protein